MGAHLPVRNFLLFKKLHEVRARHVQEFSCLAGGKLLICRSDGYGPALGDLFEGLY